MLEITEKMLKEAIAIAGGVENPIEFYKILKNKAAEIGEQATLEWVKETLAIDDFRARFGGFSKILDPTDLFGGGRDDNGEVKDAKFYTVSKKALKKRGICPLTAKEEKVYSNGDSDNIGQQWLDAMTSGQEAEAKGIEAKLRSEYYTRSLYDSKAAKANPNSFSC